MHRTESAHSTGGGHLSMMVARMFSLGGVNLVGAVITTNCSMIFYIWSIFVFSGIVVSMFLPSDTKMNRILNESSN